MSSSNMPTNKPSELLEQPPKPKSNNDYGHVTRYLVEYISSVLKHLESQFLTNKVESLAKSDESNLLNVLIVSELTTTTTQLIDDLNNQLIDIISFNIQMTHISESDFLLKPFDKRYELGIYIDESLLTFRDQSLNNNNDNSALNTSTDSNNFKLTVIKLRDLFAQQTLLFLPEINNKGSLKEFGFNLTSSDCVPNSRVFNMPINCWQFNLYDYKHKPDWLNAKYWANPENFDKYRW